MSTTRRFSSFIDGYFGTPRRNSRTPRRYPFAGNGDLNTAEYDAFYVVDQGVFTPTARGTLDPEARSVAIASANTGTEVITTATPHGFAQGQCVHLVVNSGLTGLTTGKAYWIIYVSATTLKLATTSDLAAAGTPVDIIADGTGTLYEGFYLIAETTPEIQQGDTAMFRRTYSNIPATQTVPTSLFVPKPDLSSVAAAAGGYADFTEVPTIGGVISGQAYVHGGYTFASPYAYSRVGGNSTFTAPTSGTFTLTYKTDTTSALNYNDSGATIAAALNGLGDVIADGLTFTVETSLGVGAQTSNALTLTLTAGATTEPVTMDASGLSPAGAQSAFTEVVLTTSQSIRIGDRVTLPSHGFNGAENLLVYAYWSASTSQTYFHLLPPTLWEVVDTDTIAFRMPSPDGDPASVFGQTEFSYAPGSVLSRGKRITTFYLPGKSVGITTMDDVPLPTYQGDPATLLAQILAGNTSINYEVGELGQWRESPILARPITTINGTQL